MISTSFESSPDQLPAVSRAIDSSSRTVRMLLTLSNLKVLQNEYVPQLISTFESSFSVKLTDESKTIRHAFGTGSPQAVPIIHQAYSTATDKDHQGGHQCPELGSCHHQTRSGEALRICCDDASSHGPHRGVHHCAQSRQLQRWSSPTDPVVSSRRGVTSAYWMASRSAKEPTACQH